MARSLAGSRFSTESAHGPSIMGSEDEVEQSLGRPCPAAGPSGLTNSPHPSSREGHHSTAWWSSGFLLLLMALGAHAVTCLVPAALPISTPFFFETETAWLRYVRHRWSQSFC